jgi:hypothetical protein
MRCFELSGDYVAEGIALREELVLADDGDTDRLLAVWTGNPAIERVGTARVGLDPAGTVVLGAGHWQIDEDRALVLVREYHPGTGRKRYPSFHVNWEQAGDIRLLARVTRQKGSGTDTYSLIVAPADWAHKIASQFRNERDAAGQVISYLPSSAPVPAPVSATEVEPVAKADQPEVDMETAMAALRARFGSKKSKK